MNMKFKAGELQGYRKVIEYLWDGEAGTMMPLLFIKNNYKRWDEIFVWMKDNKLIGKKLVEFFQNEGDGSGRGYHIGVLKILSRIDGKKNHVDNIKVDQLL